MPANRRVLRKIKQKWKRFPSRMDVSGFQHELDWVVSQAVLNFHSAYPNEKILFIGSSGVPLKVPQVSVDIAMPHEKTSTHVVGDAEKLPFKSGSFGFGVSVFTFDYLKKKKATKELLRVLKPGGQALVVLHHPQSVLTRGSKASFLQAKSLRKYFGEVKKTWSLTSRKKLFEALRTFGNYPGVTLMDLRQAGDILHRETGTPEQLRALDRVISKIQGASMANPRSELFRLEKNMFKSKESVERFFNENGFHAQTQPLYTAPGVGPIGWMISLVKQKR